MLQKKSSAQTIVAGDPLPLERPRPGGALIMIAEDNDDNRLMLKTLLEMWGYRVAEAGDGREAITLAQEIRPDLILTDFQLPRLNGFDVARFIRTDEGLRDVPIIVVSGHDPVKHRQLALAAGCTEYLHKPFDFDHLAEILDDLLGSDSERFPTGV